MVDEELRGRWRHYWPDADVDRMGRDVDARVRAAIAAWHLRDARPLPGGNVAAVYATADAVLKVSPRGHQDDALLASHGDALEHWHATGIVPVLHARRDHGFTLLMQRLRPGLTLDQSGLPFEERLRTLGRVAGQLRAAGPAPPAFVPLRDYAADWEPGALADPGPDDVLLHADLHGGNVLRDGDTWKVIDPHGVRGDPHAEIWALLDPLVPAVPDTATARRWVATYAGAAGLDVDRARAWAQLRAAGESISVQAEDPAWADRLRRMSRALALVS